MDMPVSSGLTTFTVRVDGEALPGSVRVVGLDVQRELDRITSASLVLHDGDAAAQRFAASEDALLVPGSAIEIDGGYDRDEERLFKGVITRQRIEATRAGDTFLHVEARDPAYRAALTRRSRTFVDVADADAIADALREWGLDVDIETGRARPQIVQHRATDWDFALQRAGALGLVSDCDGDAVRFFTPDPAQAAARAFEFGRDVHRMELELDAESQVTSVEAGAWSPADRELLLGESEAARSAADAATPELVEAGGGELRLRHCGPRDQASVDAWAEARLVRSRQAAVRGTVEVQGTAGVAPGDTVELRGLGARFSGTLLVSGVRHQIGRGDWLTTIQVGLDPRRHDARHADVAAPPAAGLIPPIHGLHVGVVAALADDPLGEERIQVRLVTADRTEGLVWARLATADAGADRGTVLRPEIGDEVVLGFLDSDPRDPVVLGSLHSSAAPAPIPADDENHEKGYVSRAGVRVVVDDDRPAVVVETPGGAAVRIDDDARSVEVTDQNGNVVTMGDSAIAFDAAADLQIKARGDVSIEGVNVKLAASATASVEGSAAAKLESSGQTTVKGSLVMIN